jgi:hypothetical protein
MRRFGLVVELMAYRITSANRASEASFWEVAVEAHRFRRDFLISSRAGADLPTRPEPLLPFSFI